MYINIYETSTLNICYAKNKHSVWQRKLCLCCFIPAGESFDNIFIFEIEKKYAVSYFRKNLIMYVDTINPKTV